MGLSADRGPPTGEIPCPPVEETWLTDFMKPFDETTLLDTLTSQEAVLRIQKQADESM